MTRLTASIVSIVVPALLLALVMAGAVRPAAAHFAPDPTQNNRYAKLTLLPGAVRISYTVYFGDRPGQRERQRIDRNADGLIDDAERDAFGASIVGEIGPQLWVEVDGVRTTASWAITDVGLGTPQVAGGSFSVDLLMTAPLADPAKTTHVVYLEDHWPAPSPGENEVRVEESPGVRVVESHIRRDGRGAQLRFSWTGGTSNPEERGVLVRFTVDAELARAAAAAGGESGDEESGPAAVRPGADTTGHRTRTVGVVVGLGVLVVVAAAWLVRKRRSAVG